MMGVYEVRIPRWHPLSLNRLLRMHWARRNATLRDEAALVKIALIGADVPRATSPRKAFVVLSHPSRVIDADNGLKGLLDALVATGRLVDDSARGLSGVEARSVRVAKGEWWGTTVVLTDDPPPLTPPPEVTHG